jgi:hypothetical protein
MRKPVYEPGPLLTATASSSVNVIFPSFTTSSQNTVSISAWRLASLISRKAMIFPLRDNATEQTVVEDSIRRRFKIQDSKFVHLSAFDISAGQFCACDQ